MTLWRSKIIENTLAVISILVDPLKEQLHGVKVSTKDLELTQNVLGQQLNGEKKEIENNELGSEVVRASG